MKIAPNYDFDTYKIGVEEIKAEVQRFIFPSHEGEMLNEYEKYRIIQGIDYPKPDAVFSLGEVPIFTKKSISLFTAKAKAGKTTVLAWISARLVSDNIKVLWLDTEQGEYYGSRTQAWILGIAELSNSENLNYFNLRTISPSERVQALEKLTAYYTPDVVVIDGVRDIVFDINSCEQATETATLLMRICEMNNCHIANILHQNKGDGNARGHLGAELVNKCETGIKISADEQNHIVVEAEYTRGEPFKAFALERDGNGMPFLIDNWVAESASTATKASNNDISDFEKYSLLNSVYSHGDEFGYSELVIQVKIAFNETFKKEIGENRAKEIITECKNKGWLAQEAERKPYRKAPFEPVSENEF